MEYTSTGRKIFQGFNYTLFALLALACIFPLIHVLALSFSSSNAATAGLVKLWPVDFTLSSYSYVLKKPEFVISLGVTFQRLVLGTIISMLLTIVTAYPLSKETRSFRMRTMFVWFFVFTMLFNGGLIPTYMIVRDTGIMDTIWALVLPAGVNVFNVVLMLNFYRTLPKELEESAFMDGAGHWTALLRIFLPLSLPALATIGLFTMVFHWNSWFDGLIYMNRQDHYPLSTYLQTVLFSNQMVNVTAQDLETLREISDRTAKAAQIFIGSFPILLVYPFLQRFFIKGIVLGSVKE